MYFDFRTYFRFLYLALFPGKKTVPRSPRRVVGLLIFFLFFPVFELFTAACLLLDHIFFPGFRKVELTQPLFIVGPHRSGTTYLHRLLAEDKDQFFCFTLWEILFPSILQKKILAWIGRIDGRFGGPLAAAVRRREDRRLGSFKEELHEMSLFKPAEDDLLLIHTFSTLVLGFFVDAGVLERELEGGTKSSDYRWLLYFDTMASERNRKRVMRFYRACVKRQGYYKGGKRRLLSKAPFSCLRVDALYQYFPGCRMIYTIRNPLQAVPSMLDMVKKVWQSTAAMQEDFPLKSWAYQTVKNMYQYPFARFAQTDEARYKFIIYDNLVQQPVATVKAIYDWSGDDLDEGFLSVLEPEDEKQRKFRSRHEYSLAHFGLQREQILKDFREIFDRYGFDTASG